MEMPVYDFDAFTPAKKGQVKEEKKPKLKKVNPVRKSEEELREEGREARRKTLKAVCVAMVVIIMASMNLIARAQCDSMDRKIKNITEQINMVEGTNTEYAMKLSNMVSIEQIEKVAVETLGLVKIKQNDIEYIKLAKENKVLYTAGKLAE